jgi:dienelactone hydrolase
MIKDTQYEVEGRRLSGVVATDEKQAPTRRPGILVLHGGGGVGAHEHGRLEQLAGLGYVAFAPDLFGETFTDRAHGMAVIGRLVSEPATLRSRLEAAWRRLVSEPGVDAARTAAMGHCFGGLAALELARSGADVRAVVSLHGGLAVREEACAGDLRARVLACAGAEDPFCPREQRAAFEDEMTRAGADWQLHVYARAKHGFTVRGIDPVKHPGCAYDEASDRRSWQATRALFDEVL